MYRTEYVGRGARTVSADGIPEDANHVMVVTGTDSFRASGASEFVEELQVAIERYVAPSPNPELASLKEGIDRCEELEPDAVIGIGGGSIIDSAKAIAVLSDQPGPPRAYGAGERTPERTGYPLVAVPTTAGTGTETTHFATIYVDGEKYSLVGKPVYPDTAIVDPEFLVSVPERVRASTGADVLTQAIESYWSIQSTDASRRLAGAAIEIVWEHLQTEVRNPSAESRDAMARAAHLAGKAIDISKTTACHSVSYPMTAQFGLSHGTAVSLTLASFLEFNAGVSSDDCLDPRGAAFVSARLDEIVERLGASSPKAAARAITSGFEDIGLPVTLDEAGVTNLDLVLEEGFTPDRIGNNPRKVRRDDLEIIIHSLA